MTPKQPGARPKVFCIGFQKTGTSSLRDALRQAGYDVRGVFGRGLGVEELRACYVERGLAIASQCDAVQDMPWPLMFRQLDETFPGARFILTLREEERWYGSILSHFGTTHDPLQQLTYGDDAPCPAGHEARYRQVYAAHNRQVLDYFAARPDDLLVMELEKGHGWDELAAFLGLEGAPRGPFVHANSSRERATLKNRIRKKLHKLGVIGSR